MDNSCKRRAYCLYRSIILHTEHGEWQASLAHEKSACLAEVSVTDMFYGNFQNSQKSWGELSMRKQCVPGSFFSAHAQEPGNEAIFKCAHLNFWSCYSMGIASGSINLPSL